MKKKELIVKTKYEELYKTEYGYWIEHIEYEDEAETVRFEGGGCSISNEVVDKLLDKAREEEEVEESVWDMLEREEDGYIKEISNYWQKNGHKHIEIEIVPNEPDEPEKVYVDPIVPNFTEELSWPVEYKTRKQVKEMFKDTPEETESDVQEWEEELSKLTTKGK